jgi:hypothetical protein
MKKQLLIAFLLLTCSCFVTFSQFEYYKPDSTANKHKAGDFIMSVSPNLLMNTPNGMQIAGGIKIQVFISKRFSLDGDLVFGRDYLHVGPGLVGIPLGILVLSTGGNSENFGDSFTGVIFGALAVVSGFEHISYHIPLSNNLDLAPYISLLRFKYSYEYGNYSNPDFISEQLCFASGIQLNKYFGRFVLSPYAEFDVGYKDHAPGFNIGAYFGIYFKSKRN